MSIRERTSQAYLSQIYFDDKKLLEFALSEFEKCHRSGRLTAFVGSMATGGLGYPDWAGLIGKAPEAVKDVAGDKIAAEFEKNLWNDKLGPRVAKGTIDGRVAASIIGYWLDHAVTIRDAGMKLNESVAKAISFDNGDGSTKDQQSILTNLLEDLKITRFITTNYDAEIEFAIREKFHKKVKARYLLLDEWKADAISDGTDPAGAGGGAHLRLTLDDGNVLASDAFSRNRLDRLIEFSVGAADVDFHVLHLHGRVDRPETMVISYRDYDRLYREAGASKLPFDQALAMLHSTNPVLFVGLGMREPELNRALEDLVGNQPFRGLGRRFLLWSPHADKQRMTVADRWAFRVEKLHKLGVLTIFDDEVPKDYKSIGIDLSLGDEAQARQKRLNLALALKELNVFTQTDRNKRLERIDDHAWRRIAPNDSRMREPIIFTWHFARSFKDTCIFAKSTNEIVNKIQNHHLIVETSRPGTNKGAAATALAMAWVYKTVADGAVEARTGRQVLFINASLRLDTDSILELLFQFLCLQSGCSVARERKQGGEGEEVKEPKSREHGFRFERTFFKPKFGEPLIIFKGLERLFGKSGLPLSAELDSFFRCYLRAVIDACKNAGPPERLCPIVAFGTRRVRVYFRRLQAQVCAEVKSERLAEKVIKIEHLAGDPDGYVRSLAGNHSSSDADNGAARLADDHGFARRTYRDFFRSKDFRNSFKPGSGDEGLAFAILTIMAFVGQPVEAEVLFHAPRINEAMRFDHGKAPSKQPSADEVGTSMMRSNFDRVLDKLKNIKSVNSTRGGENDRGLALVFQIEHPVLVAEGAANPGKYHMPRYALHNSLQTEIRERYGVPLSEAVLSTSFNMSLYAAQPADAAISDPQVHDELGKLINWFAGVHNDLEPYRVEHRLARRVGRNDPRYRARPHVAAALRAALAIARGFYSTSALLSLDIGDRQDDEQRDGALTEHGARIERIIKAFTKLAESRAKLAKQFGDDEGAVKARLKALGPGPIYTDELVWLHNERGVVKLTQGDLYEARFSFDQADQVNSRHVEFKCRSHNWRRIWLNQVVVDIERGKLAEAEDRIGRIERSYGLSDHVESIREELGKARPGIAPKFRLDISHEDCLAAALATGYRGLIANLRGEMHSAEGLFELAITMLENLDEQRACALFRRHYASLLQITKDAKDCTQMAKLAIAGAESVQQMDIVYAARIVRYQEFARSNDAEHRKRAMLNFTKALEFATLTDIHRVAIEARRNLAMLKLDNGDLESALEHASVAMALAGRYGMTLFKVSLRIVLGRILHERGAVDAADALIRNAIVQADRIGYQRAVEGAQGAMASILKS